MRLIIYPYLPPDEWRIGFSWGGGGYHQERIRAGTYNEAAQLANRMKGILEPALLLCEKLAEKSLRQGEWFDD